MGTRTVFLRSPVGNRARSPLSAFRCRSSKFLEIFTVPDYLMDGDSYDITGELFGSSQGSGTVLISDSPDFDSSSVIVSQSVTYWDDNTITFTFDDDSLLDDMVWIRVISDTGDFDTKATSAVKISAVLSMADNSIQISSATTICGNPQPARYCHARLEYTSFYGYSGYSYGARASGVQNYFYETSPGFYLIGATSGKVVELPYRTQVVPSVSVPPTTAVLWCAGSEGLATGFLDDLGLSGDMALRILYEELTGTDPCTSTHGWTNGETVYLAPKYPLSISITDPEDEIYVAVGASYTLEAFAYSTRGSLANNIRWYNGPSANISISEYIGLGDSVTLANIEGTNVITAVVNNSQDQGRSDFVTITALPLEITSVDPVSGDPAGGNTVTIDGQGFTATTTVEFGGSAATSITFIDLYTLTCAAPAGTGTVDVTVEDGAQSDTLTSGYTYSTGGITVTNVSPGTGTSGGGTSVTVTGTGFTSDCAVFFAFPNIATNITFINSTTITCDTPAGTGTVDVLVVDFVTFEDGTLVSGFTYT